MLNVGIVGASGYTGEELNKILIRHPAVRIASLTATSTKENSQIKVFNPGEVISCCDLIFFSLPTGEAMKFVPQMLSAGKKVIDLGADYRLKDTGEYKEWYKTEHLDKKNVSLSVYGLTELYKDKIKKAKLVSNPGCYPTAAILGLLPLLKRRLIKTDSIVIDAKSGLSGAGRKLAEGSLCEELKDNFRPYKINYHQHMPEINQELSGVCGKKISVNFVPHLLPIFRGLLATVYVKISAKVVLSEDKLRELYKTTYKDEPFVRIRNEGKIPQIKDVVGTNFCDIGIFYQGKHKMAVIVSVIDNLVKGAAGQAVQNMNLIYGFKETESLL
ncbi:MAG: N-acetyl-gamma-glutamyl-phosphate reductase [Candidatus Omnitrophota bacterium]